MYSKQAELLEKQQPKLKPAKSIIRTGDDEENEEIVLGQDAPEDAFQAREDFSILKQTFKGEAAENFFAFQEKATNILEEQEDIIATHMATIQKDAKLLTQES